MLDALPVIRRLGVGDGQEYARLLEILDHMHWEQCPTLIKAPQASRVDIPAFLAMLANPDLLLLGAENGSGLVGILRASYQNRPAGRAHHARSIVRIEEIMVEPIAQRRGVGRALMKAVSDWTQSRNVRAMELGAYAWNESAQAWYHALGFTTERLTLVKEW